MSGASLECVADLSGECGITYDRGATFEKTRVVADRPLLYFPRNASAFMVEVEDPRASHRVDASSVMLLPGGAVYDIASVTSVAEIVAVLPSRELLRKTARQYAIAEAVMDAFFETSHRLVRTTWLDELHHRYVFERLASGQTGNLATAFLEMEIVKEAYFLGTNGHRSCTCVQLSHLSTGDTLTNRALAFIEGRLFEPLTLPEIANAVGASRSGVLRAFRRHVGKPPNEYLRDRRLEEASILIGTGRYAVGHVARIVGYENVSAFSQAFKRKYQVLPSEWACA